MSGASGAIRILVVDDSISVQHAVRDAFAGVAGHEVVACGEAEAAESLSESFSPSLVFCDVILPDRSGYDLCRTLKTAPGGAARPVILLAGSFEPFDPDRAREVGADGMLQKPFTAYEIREQVQNALAAHPEHASASGAEPHARIERESGVPDLEELTEADVLSSPPDAGAVEAAEGVDRAVVEAVTARLLGPVTEWVRTAVLRALQSGELGREVREAVLEAAERQVSRRIAELERDPEEENGRSGPEPRRRDG